jgi:adenine-specific DNA-methyltransferase
MTDAETRLWSKLRYRQLDNCKFRRQATIGKYIVDFVTFERKIIIELDGGQHAEQVERDSERTNWLQSQGFAVLRFWNHEVLEDMEAVIEVIWNAVRAGSPHPNPPPQGGEGIILRALSCT